MVRSAPATPSRLRPGRDLPYPTKGVNSPNRSCPVRTSDRTERHRGGPRGGRGVAIGALGDQTAGMTALSDHRTVARPTMADAAAEAHVSVKTVSRVVTHEPGVRPDTAERVRAVIERLGFRRHDGARLMRQGRTFTIALVVEDLANPFYSQVGAAVEREARIRQHQLITASAEGSPTRERAVIEALINRRVDGIVVVPADEGASSDPAVEASGTPIVYMDRPVRGAARDTVLSDNQGGFRSAVEHLVAHGHRSIAFFGDDPAFWTARQRRESFVGTHRSLGLAGPPRVS